MIISFSRIRQFRRCPRQWGFDYPFANSQVKNNPLRKEAFILSQLQTLEAWRGDIVDHVISKKIVPELIKGRRVKKSEVLTYARSVFDAQLDFALNSRIREEGMTQKIGGDKYAALMAIEYENQVEEEQIDDAWNDVSIALMTLLGKTDLLDRLSSAKKLMAQRKLLFQHFQAHFRAVPDLVALYDHLPPLIIDWKVHRKGIHDYHLQLAAYAIALTRCEPHSDFPDALFNFSVEDFHLLEVQLLTGIERPYRLSADDIAEVDNYLSETTTQMLCALDGKSSDEINPFDLPVTSNPDNCQWCGFSKICMESPICQPHEQMTLISLT